MSKESFKNGGCPASSEAVTSSVYAEARASEAPALEDVRKGLPSASGLERLVLCPGSWLAEAAVPKGAVSEAAAMGTRLHADMEHGTVPADVVEAEAVAWCREMEAALVAELFDVCEPSAVREVRLWDGAQRFSGQGDVVYRGADGRALVLDYKFGYGEVAKAESNCQLYGLALLLFDNDGSLEEVYAGILQPFVCRERPRLVRFGREDVAQLRRFVYGALDAAQVPGARLCPGEAQCRYCRAAAGCPALGLQVEKVSGVQVQGWASWGVADRRRAWDMARLARRWADAVERRVREDLEGGVELPGLVLGAGRSSFTVHDAAGAFGVLCGYLELSGEEFAGCCKVGMTELDKLVHAKLAAAAPEGVKQTVKRSREWLREVLADVGEVKTSAGSIKEV